MQFWALFVERINKIDSQPNPRDKQMQNFLNKNQIFSPQALYIAFTFFS
jgi:hypothetical protein